MVGADDSSLRADSAPNSVDMVFAWHFSTLIKWTVWTLTINIVLSIIIINIIIIIYLFIFKFKIYPR